MKNQQKEIKSLSPGKIVSIALCINLLCLCLFLTELNAQPAVCIPQAVGVPANPGPPIWWDKDGDSSFPEYPSEDDRVDDPRWKLSASITHPTSGGGATEHAAFRALYRAESGQTFLYLSWHVKVDPQLNNDLDFLIVGFSPGLGSQDVILRITPYHTSSPLPKKAEQPYNVEAHTSSDGGVTWVSWSGGAEPGWSNDYTRIWLEQTGSNSYSWAIQMRVPITTSAVINLNSGLNLGDSFKMWYELQAYNAGGYTAYAWPDSVTISYSSIGEEILPPISSWGDFCVGSCPASTGLTCASGISLASYNIGTTNTDSAGNPTPHRIDPTNPNIFFAKPRNDTGSTIGAGNLTARFRIANWGSLPDWNDVSNPELLWGDIPIPGGSAASNSADISDGTEGWIQTNPWTLTDCERIDFTSDPWPVHCNAGTDPARYRKRVHQCILVELSGPGLVFTNRSVHRNMDFATASKFSREAEISVVGLGADALSRPKRDVYLYVQTMNMPEVVNKDELRKAKAVGTIAVMEESWTFQQIAERLPTYIVHVYHDTGERKKIDSVQYSKLRPQTSFGYFIQHKGELEGWNHILNGAILIAPDFYKIGVPNDSASTITTEIVAREPGGLFRRCFDWFF